MGFGSADLDVLLRLRKNGYIPDGASIIEIGAQQLNNDFLTSASKIQEARQSFHASGDLQLPEPLATATPQGEVEHQSSFAPLARDFWRWLGFDYASVDIDESPGSISLDLNYDGAPRSAVGKYQVVTNFGTTEHITNQLNAFKVIHDLAARGGVMWHNLPVQGMLNHGFMNYNPKFFWMLARSNGYKWLYSNYLNASMDYSLPENILANIAESEPEARVRLKDIRIRDSGYIVVLQKVFDLPFVGPLDVNTGMATSNKKLARRYWTVFRPDAFQNILDRESARRSARSTVVGRTWASVRSAFGRDETQQRLVEPQRDRDDERGEDAERQTATALAQPPAPVPANSDNEVAIDPPPDYSGRQAAFVNHMEAYRHVFDGVTPWSGKVPRGYMVDFSGALLDAEFRTMFGVDPRKVGGKVEETRLPIIEDGENGEGWFEAVNWVTAAREAKDRFVMITLGALYGAQAVGCYRMLQQLNPMPCKLVAVEPVPENYAWLMRHFRDNGLDPDEHWLVPHAIAADIAPVLFPIGAPGSGAQNAVATNNTDARKHYVDVFSRAGGEATNEALSNLLLHNTTGLTRDLVEGYDFKAEIKLVSAITLRELLGPFNRVDYLESDIQQSEIEVFPPFIDLLRKKVHRIHIGTHGQAVHWTLHDLFAGSGWKIVFSFEPNARHDTALGSFETNDGVLTVVNPDL